MEWAVECSRCELAWEYHLAASFAHIRLAPTHYHPPQSKPRCLRRLLCTPTERRLLSPNLFLSRSPIKRRECVPLSLPPVSPSLPELASSRHHSFARTDVFSLPFCLQLARRLRFPTPPTFDALQSKLVSLWATSGLTASCLALSYLDSDGDRVVLSSDAELQDFFEDIRHRGVEGEVVKMRVLILGQEGTGGGGDREEATMDVEVEAAGAEDKEIEVRSSSLSAARVFARC